jgi:7-cyano-7-deazaguanine reductase
MSSNILGVEIKSYPDLYDKSCLFPIKRSAQRAQLGLTIALPFLGYDWWNHYEFTWLNKKTGWPEARLLSIIIPCTSESIVESKSLKLYLGSFANSLFHEQEIIDLIEEDLKNLLCSPIKVLLQAHKNSSISKIYSSKNVICLDDYPTFCSQYEYCPSLLKLAPQLHKEEVSSFSFQTHIFRSNCLITHQPDWASLELSWLGKPIDQESLYQYLVSFRLHNEFHEHCIERIFIDLYNILEPKSLSVRGFFTRRGSVDINPCRSTFSQTPSFHRNIYH